MEVIGKHIGKKRGSVGRRKGKRWVLVKMHYVHMHECYDEAHYSI